MKTRPCTFSPVRQSFRSRSCSGWWCMLVWRGGCGSWRSAFLIGRPIVPPSPEAARPELLFAPVRLAEPALRRVLSDLAPRVGFEPVVAVLPISVAALLTTDWVARHLEPPAD